MRVPLVIGLFAFLLLVAIPLYLWRRPRSNPSNDAALALAAAAVLTADSTLGAAGAPSAHPAPDPSARRVALGDTHMARCQAGRLGRIPGERCDKLPFFEESLARAVRENAACAPQLGAGGTVSFVLSVDFAHRRTHLWAGRSGSIHKPRANDLLRCVAQAIPTPDWNMAHQFDRYDVNVVATYPPAGTLLPEVGMTGGGPSPAAAAIAAAPGAPAATP